ncbi:MAG TPA: cation:proton antiporter [Candidatus Saccharimonadales bacterium]|nr:cation:proton antiporter [Candidatus Saccharimonadales bacterium]
MDTVFPGLSLIIVIAAAVALLMKVIGQPQIIGYILTGIIVGPAVFHVAKSPDTLALFSDLGIALLLFIIGLGLNPRVIKEVGRTAVFVGVSQVGIVTALGFIASRLFGLGGRASLFVGFSLAISSTIIILKLISDKKEQGRLYGKIAVSVSLVQDIIAIALVVLTSAGNNQSVDLGTLVSLLIKTLFLGGAIYVISFRVLPRFHHLIAGSQEFLFLFAIAWGLGSAALFQKIGLSTEIGALLAGICLAPLPSAPEIGARLRPLRDFFLIVFFIALGSNLTLSSISDKLGLIIAGVLIAAVLKPLVAMSVLGFLGYTKRTSFKASLGLAQVSEFSIVLILIAHQKGLISSPVVSAIVLMTLLSIAASTYMIIFSDHLFNFFERYLGMFERRKAQNELKPEANYELVLFGYQRGGHEFINLFKKLKKKYVVVDYDPEVIDVIEERKLNYLYGDATDVELLEEAGVDHAKLIVSTIPDYQTNLVILNYLMAKNPKAIIVIHADDPYEAAKLYEAGASYVILPHYIGSEKVSEFISKSGLAKAAFRKQRLRHLDYLEKHYGALEKLSQINERKLGRSIVQRVASMSRVSKAKA